VDPEDVRHRPKKDSFERNHHRPSPIGDTHALNTLPARTTSSKLGPDSWGSFIKLGFHQRRRLKADASDRALYSEDDRKGRLAGEASAAAHAMCTETTPSGRQGIVRLSDERTGTVSCRQIADVALHKSKK
jgi:hypothetical protein